jgi:hypothetical protein
VLFLHNGRGYFFEAWEDFLRSRDREVQLFLSLDAYLLPSL